MKNFKPSILTFVCSLALSGLTFGQNTHSMATSSETLTTTIKDTTLQKTDIVINLQMIESFKRCYDKIEVISWADLFRDLQTEDASTAWIAYKRLKYIPSADSLSNANFAKEKIKVQNEIANSGNQIKSILEPTNEEKLALKQDSSEELTINLNDNKRTNL